MTDPHDNQTAELPLECPAVMELDPDRYWPPAGTLRPWEPADQTLFVRVWDRIADSLGFAK